MFKRLFTTALVFGAAALAPPAYAQAGQCMPREMLIENLQSKYSEHLTGGGLQSPQQLLEVWSSSESGSFTVFVTRPNGVSCVMATGRHWNVTEPPEVQEGVAS